MPNNRKEAQEYILKYVEKLLPESGNKELYETFFTSLDDKQFEEFIVNLGEKKTSLCITVPNFHKAKLSVERNFAIAEELGHDFFQKIWLTVPGTDERYLTPIKYLVIKLSFKRQAQLLTKKISVPEDNKTVDDYSGQPTGASKGSKISYPELGVLAAMGLDRSTEEMLKYRGGDTRGFNAMNRSISQTGSVYLDAIEPLADGVEVNRTINAFFKAMHLSSTL